MNIDPWMQAMLRGDFAAAWKISDSLLTRKQDRRVPRQEQSIWDGTPVVGKRVLVRCYHGLGDTIQFIRYAALLKCLAAEVIVWVQPSLIPLLRTVTGIDQLLPLHEGEPDVAYDVDVELNEMPFMFRTTLDNIPADVPYLHVDSDSRLDRVSLPQSGGSIRVGLIWQSGEWNPSRSIPFPLLLPLAKLPGIQWHILQRHAHSAGWNGDFGVLSGGNNPLDDARLMRALDLVISADTMTAHLAGALGQNTWTLLPFNPDWRWMNDRDDSPWYPTMRLFRQKREGDWNEVIEEVARELTKAVALSPRQSEAVRLDL